MKKNLPKLGAGLLSLAVVGVVTGLLTMSLVSAQPISLAGTQPALAKKAATGQTAIETVVVFGHRPTNYASLAVPQNHHGAAGTKYVAVRLGGQSMTALK